jgi:hypothetical protein
VFILGAGASAPYGYPVGTAFKDDICLKFKSDIESLILSSGESSTASAMSDLVDQTDEFIGSFQGSRINSIDRWLSLNPRFGNIGKLAIVNSIVKCEHPDKLVFEGRDKSLDWFTVLFNKMISGLSRPDQFQYLQVPFITFNYDRLLEHLFYESFRNTFTELSAADIARMLSSLYIIHAYGAIDDPPWKKGRYIYGTDYTLKYLNAARGKIRIMDEGSGDNAIDRYLEEQILQDAKRMFFLGFGYDADNLRILGIPDRLKNNPQIFGTALGLLPEEIDRVRKMIGPQATIEGCDSTELLRKYLT